MFSRLSKLMAVALVVAMLAGAVVSPALAQREIRRFKNIPVTGTVEDGGTFEGQFNIQSFFVEGEQIYAGGYLSGRLRDATGRTRTVRNEWIEMPVSFPAYEGSGEFGTMQFDPDPGGVRILELTLGPLDLFLLGLRVQLDEVHLLITAHPGQGLLGDLLAAIAGLLGGLFPPPPPAELVNLLQQIVVLLNQLLDIIG